MKKTKSKEKMNNEKSSKKSLSLRSTSLESTSSFDEIFLFPLSLLPPELFGEITYDCCVFLVYCEKHNTIAIAKGKTNWLPFMAMKSVDQWMTVAINGLMYILGHGDVFALNELSAIPFHTPELIEITRVQLPQQPKFTTRLTFVVRMNNKIKDYKCCENDRQVEWIDRDYIREQEINFWGPEPYLYLNAVGQKMLKKRFVNEYSMEDILSFIKGREQKMLKSAGLGNREILKMFVEYVSHSFPSLYLSTYSFYNFLTKIGWKEDFRKSNNIFSAFNFTGKGYLTFQELILGLAAMEPSTKHTGEVGLLRLSYIFRYYDKDNDNKLDYDDIKRMSDDISAHRDFKDSKAHKMESLKIKKKDKIDFATFSAVVTNHSIRGMSVLFRAEISIMNFISGGAKKVQDGVPHILTRKRQYRGTCLACKQVKNFTISLFSVKLDYTGRITEAYNMKKTEKKNIKWSSDDPTIVQFRQFAVDTLFNPTSLPNKILDILRQFDSIQKKRINETKPEVKDWGEQGQDFVFNSIQALCKKAEDIFEKETRCVTLSSPVYVFGDIHGNMADLLVYERNIWRAAPGMTRSNYLFLGDYVDRGDFGVEVVCYLFAMKILAPDSFYLCRGNHEIRSIQKCFTFYKECLTKFGNKIGPVVFETCNKAFDRMPICAVIDEKIYGAHGGIPTSVTRIEELMTMPTPLQEPENECPAAWEIMWNDPMNLADFVDLAEFMKVNREESHGFLSNSKRGTGYYYSDDAVDNFLQTNSLQHVVRGHEVMQPGYKFHMNGKVTTVFSSSRYCGGTNESATLFVDNDEIRIVKFETYGELKE